MGQSQSELKLSNEQSLCAVDIDSDFVVQHLKHPAVWDESFATVCGSHSEHVEGTQLSKLLGHENVGCMHEVLHHSQGNTVTMHLDLGSDVSGTSSENGQSFSGSRDSNRSSLVAIMYFLPSKNGCCTMPLRRIWLLPEHLANSQKLLSRADCPTISKCVTCNCHSVNGLEYFERVDLFVSLCRKSTYMFHRVAKTSCRKCNVQHAFNAQVVQITTPRARKKSDALPLFSPRTEEEVQKRTYALVVVPDSSTRERLDTLLQRLKCIPVICNSAAKAVSYVYKGEPVGLVICDVMLASTSGLELIKQLREMNNGIPILAVGGSVGFSDLAIQCGANAFHLRSTSDADFRISIISLCAAVL